MKKFLLPTLGLIASMLTAQAQQFTTGNLAVLRIGGAGQTVTTTDSGNTVSIDQYTTNGTLVNTLAIPSTGTNALILNGLAYVGSLTLTPDLLHLVIPGFNTSLPYLSNGFPSNVAFSYATTVPRAIATIDGYGNYALPIANTGIYNTYTISGAASDGSNYWALGTGATAPALSGLVYCGTATAPATNEVATGLFGGGRCLNIYNNGLYALGYPASGATWPQSGAWLMANISGALPTTSTTFTQPIQTGPEASDTPFDLVINSLGTIAYVADSTAGIVKFTNSGSGWVSNYTILLTNAGYNTASGSSRALSVTADFTQTPPVVYATTAETITNRLVVLQDTGANATVINLASNLNVSGAGGSTNTFRGVRFVPGSAPQITSQPSGASLSADATATFTVSSLGSATLAYQWYTNSVAVSGATSSSFTISPVTTFQNGTLVNVVVSNAYGSMTSSNATLTVAPNYFVSGNLAVVSVGGMGQYVSSSDTGNSVSILQFTTSPGQSSPVSTLTLPSTGPNAFVLDGSATEGFMTLTANGQYLVLGGYNAAPPVAGGLAASASTNVPRAVVTVDGYGNYSMPISNPNIFSTYNIRGAVFDGTNNFWVSSAGAPTGTPKGIVYVGTPGSIGASAVQVQVGITGTGNERCLNIFSNTLYVSTGSATHGIWSITGPSSPPPPTGLPTNAPVNTVVQPGSGSGPYDFAFDSGNTTCYVADGNLGGIIKYTNSGSSWVSNYTLLVGGTGSSTNAGGLTVDFTQNPPVLYATTSEAVANRLISIVDNGASSTFSVLATASSGAGGSNYFRGVRFVPGVKPSVTNGPVSFTQDAGGSATFTVGATGTPTLGYQWYTNSSAVSGATASSLTLNSLVTNQNGTTVSVVVSNAYGTSASTNAILTVQPPGAPLNVSIAPTSQTVNAGSAAVFNASAVGTSLTFYWYLNNTLLNNGGSVSGAGTATLTIGPAYATYNGTYTVIASNSFGFVPGNNSATLTVIDPIIVTEPAGSTNLPGASANLSVAAKGAPALTYLWYSNSSPVSSATSSTLSVSNNGATISASYSVVVSNALGNSVTSTPAVVSFTPLLLYEPFNYANGNLFLESPWTDINGSNPQLVISNRGQIAQTNATTDAQRLFTQPEGNNVMWASFTVNLSTLPSNPGGVYFANIEDNNFNFFGRIFTLTSNQPVYTPNIPNVAFPGTYRLGIASAQNDSGNTGTSGPAAVVPLDLAPGIDYHVVYYVDFGAQISGMSINPAAIGDVQSNSPGGVSSGAATDSFDPSGQSTRYTNQLMNAFGMRQRQGEGILAIDDIAVSFDYNGPGTGYTAVTSGIVATNPVIGLQPAGGTNLYLGNPYMMEVAASGIGTAGNGLTYAWYQNGAPLSDGTNITGSATPTLTFNSLVGTNSGTYYVTVKGTVGSPVQSSNAVISVITTPTAPVFTEQPAASTTLSEGATCTLTSQAFGTGPITYEWFLNGGDLGISGANLTLSDVNTNQSGTYNVVATGGTGLTNISSNAVLIVNGPKSVTIGYLRTLLNPTTYQPTDTATLFSVTGVITTATNLTTGNTASYYLQDSTGGINLFVTLGSDFRPGLGNIVTATGTLSTYVDNYEMDVIEGAADYVDTILGTNGVLPAPILFPWGNTAPLSAYYATNVEGSVIVLTNLYFAAYVPGGTNNFFAAGGAYIVSNILGQTYTAYVSDQDTNYVTGQPMPQFAYSIAGPLVQDNTTLGIEFTVYSNLVSAPPPRPTAAAALTGAGGTNVTLSWAAVPYDYTYSVETATNLQGPWSPLASGLWFSVSNATYTDVNRKTTGAKYYNISSP